MALRGNLKELSLPDIFQLVTFSGKTGVLRIRRADEAQGSVWFRDGEVFFASSNWHTDLLGERLVRAQRITPMALDRALELRVAEPEGGKRLGAILVEEGYITDKVLEAFVQEQMQDTIFDLMRWEDGDFEFEAMPEAPEEDIGLAVSIENVIMEGSRRLEEWNRIRKKIPSTVVVFKMATAPGEGTFEISLKPIEWNLLLLIDGSHSVAELAAATNRTDFEVARIVYGLFSAGLLEFAGEDEVVAARAERTEREARFAKFEAEQAERLAAEEAVRPKAEPQLETAASVEPITPPPAESAPAASDTPAEVPEFLGAESQAQGADSAALEAAMDALLTAPPSQPGAVAASPAAPYTPGEEPAFIAASQESEGGAQPMAVPSVEDLLPDMTDLTPPVAEEPERVSAPESDVEAEPEVAPETEPEPVAEAKPEPVVATMPEHELEPDAEPGHELEPEAGQAPQLAQEAVSEPQLEPQPDVELELEPIPELPMPEPTPIDAFEFLPDAAPADKPEAEPRWEPPSGGQPLAPGSYVVVPASGIAAAPEPSAAEPILWEPPQIDFDDDVEAPRAPAPGLLDLPMVPVTAPTPDVDSALVPLGEAGVQERFAARVPEVVLPAPPTESIASQPVVWPATALEPPVAAEYVAFPAAVGDPAYSAPAEPLVEPEAATVEPSAPESVAAQATHSSGVPVLQNFEHDLMALGLGELPPELLEPAPPEEAPELEPVHEPMGVTDEATVDAAQEPEKTATLETVSPTPDVEEAAEEILVVESELVEVVIAEEPDDGVDFSALLHSLDISADDAVAAVPRAAEIGSAPDTIREPKLETDADGHVDGVISTDVFLENLSLEDEFSFKGELTDELSALTGADRPGRPSASVNKILDAEDATLQRDSRVDRATLLKIIKSIENL